MTVSIYELFMTYERGWIYNSRDTRESLSPEAGKRAPRCSKWAQLLTADYVRTACFDRKLCFPSSARAAVCTCRVHRVFSPTDWSDWSQMQCAFLQQYLFFFKVAIMLVLREEDHTLWYRPPRIILSQLFLFKSALQTKAWLVSISKEYFLL